MTTIKYYLFNILIIISLLACSKSADGPSKPSTPSKDNTAPQITDQSFIVENAPAGLSIGMIQASDADGDLFYLTR